MQFSAFLCILIEPCTLGDLQKLGGLDLLYPSLLQVVVRAFGGMVLSLEAIA